MFSSCVLYSGLNMCAILRGTEYNNNNIPEKIIGLCDMRHDSTSLLMCEICLPLYDNVLNFGLIITYLKYLMKYTYGTEELFAATIYSYIKSTRDIF